MRFTDRRVYEGPNVHALYPVIRFTLDLGPMEERPSNTLPGFTERLLEAVPLLRQHCCCFDEPGGFVRRLEEGTWMGHILEHVAIALTNLAGVRIAFGKTRGTGTEGEYAVIYSAPEPALAELAGESAKRILESLLPDELTTQWGVRGSELDAGAEVERFLQEARRVRLGPSTQSIVEAAKRRRIPVERLDEGSLLRLGTGCFQRRVRATLTDGTSVIATDIAKDKELTNELLRGAGVPVPRQRIVRDAEEAIRAAEALGGPVVVKPLDGNHGRGVSTHVRAADDVRAAYERAEPEGSVVVVEDQLRGDDHRLLVIDGKLVAAARRVPAHVVGDGEHTVRELVDAVNDDPRRGEGHESVLTRIELDDAALAALSRQDLDPDSVPETGQTVVLHETANLSTGGTAEDVTGRVHPDNARLAVRAAQVVGLDVAGIDFITSDITRSYRETEGAGVCEVNAAPGFRMHLSPAAGEAHDVGERLIEALFPEGTPAVVPIFAVTGTNGKTTTTRMLAHLHAELGKTVGFACTDGVYVGGVPVKEGDMSGPRATKMVLADPTVEVAVLEVARGGILRAGMGTSYVDVGAVTNVTNDHIGMDGIETLEDLAFVKSTVVKVARGTAVLSADDPIVLAMKDGCRRAEHVLLVSMRGLDAVRDHVEAGGRACVLEDETLVLYDDGAREPILGAAEIPATLEGAVRHNVENALFAAAMAWSGGMSLEDVRRGLRTFRMSYEATPGRMNVYEEHPFRVIMDYGHNPAGYRAMGDVVRRLSDPGRRIAVFGTRATRRDDEIRECARVVAEHFDVFVCRGEDGHYGRPLDEVPRMQAEELRRVGIDAEVVHAIASEVEAVDKALSLARPGDLVVIFAADLERTWRQITEHRPQEGPRRAESARDSLPRA